MKRLLATLLLSLSACGYQPPPNTNTSNPAYVADLDHCEDTAASDVNKKNAKTGLAWMSSPILRWGEIADAEQSCMAGKGYGSLRWCTAAELRNGNRQGNLVVTEAGIQCSDPATPPATRPVDTSPPAPAPKAKDRARTP